MTDFLTEDYRLIKRAIEWLSAHWNQQPDLTVMAEALSCAPAVLQKTFKKWAGLSPKEFVQCCTLDYARLMLDDKASILDATFETGLSSPARLHDLFVTYEALSPGEYKLKGAGLHITYGFYPSLFGWMLLMKTARGVCGLAFADDDKDKPAALADMTRRWPAATFLPDGGQQQEFAETLFNTTAPAQKAALVMIGSDFDVRVWKLLTRIPSGTTTSYKTLAKLLNQPQAARAVGAAVGRNPLAFVVPCHRVLGQGGSLCGYHWGLTRKRALIGWEQARLLKNAPLNLAP